jgi:DNA-binding response OmpR family regulator
MPFAPSHAIPVATPMMQNSPYANIRVAVVIESAVVLLDVEDTLRELGAGAIHATSSPAQALSFLRGPGFDVAILGIGGNSAAGQTLVAELERKSVSIILIESGTALSRHLPALAGQATVTVPFDTAAIADALDGALARR